MGNAKDSVIKIIKENDYEKDVRYGITKIFIKNPQTVFALEQKRSDRLPFLVTILQKVIQKENLIYSLTSLIRTIFLKNSVRIIEIPD